MPAVTTGRAEVTERLVPAGHMPARLFAEREYASDGAGRTAAATGAWGAARGDGASGPVADAVAVASPGAGTISTRPALYPP